MLNSYAKHLDRRQKAEDLFSPALRHRYFGNGTRTRQTERTHSGNALNNVAIGLWVFMVVSCQEIVSRRNRWLTSSKWLWHDRQCRKASLPTDSYRYLQRPWGQMQQSAGTPRFAVAVWLCLVIFGSGLWLSGLGPFISYSACQRGLFT